MVTGQKLGLVEISMLGVGIMIVKMVKEHIPTPLEISMLGNGRIMKDGTGQNTTQTEIYLESM